MHEFCQVISLGYHLSVFPSKTSVTTELFLFEEPNVHSSYLAVLLYIFLRQKGVNISLFSVYLNIIYLKNVDQSIIIVYCYFILITKENFIHIFLSVACYEAKYLNQKDYIQKKAMFQQEEADICCNIR